jgi:hypothetical protein
MSCPKRFSGCGNKELNLGATLVLQVVAPKAGFSTSTPCFEILLPVQNGPGQQYRCCTMREVSHDHKSSADSDWPTKQFQVQCLPNNSMTPRLKPEHPSQTDYWAVVVSDAVPVSNPLFQHCITTGLNIACSYSSLSRCSSLVNTTCLLVSSISPAKKTSSRIA